MGDGGIGIIEMLFNTSLIALVGAGEQPTHSPRRLQIMNIKVVYFYPSSSSLELKKKKEEK
ncbi:autophagy protein [Coelomomyces lativittatus]|nr:autophagy protein [Coelomomyces lativittatus]